MSDVPPEAIEQRTSRQVRDGPRLPCAGKIAANRKHTSIRRDRQIIDIRRPCYLGNGTPARARDCSWWRSDERRDRNWSVCRDWGGFRKPISSRRTELAARRVRCPWRIR